MNPLLQKAFDEVAKLPDDQQTTFAQWILDELEDDARWDAAFSASIEKIDQLAQKALAEYRAGQTEILDPDTLE